MLIGCLQLVGKGGKRNAATSLKGEFIGEISSVFKR